MMSKLTRIVLGSVVTLAVLSSLAVSASAGVAHPATSCSSATWVLGLYDNGLTTTAGFNITSGSNVELNNGSELFCKEADGTSFAGGIQMYRYVSGGGSTCITAGTNSTVYAHLVLKPCDSSTYDQDFYFIGRSLFNNGVMILGFNGFTGHEQYGCETADSTTPGNGNFITVGVSGNGLTNSCKAVPADGTRTMFTVVVV
jgi:hypothetical protein